MDDLYESPITRIVANVQSQIEEQEGRILLKVVHDAGFDVDKHELMKALAYDRHQYEKGKSDAMKNAVPLDMLCNTLSGLYEVLPCWECEKVLGEGYCQEKECGCGSIDHWKSYFEKKMEGLDAAD